LLDLIIIEGKGEIDHAMAIEIKLFAQKKMINKMLFQFPENTLKMHNVNF